MNCILIAWVGFRYVGMNKSGESILERSSHMSKGTEWDESGPVQRISRLGEGSGKRWRSSGWGEGWGGELGQVAAPALEVH